MKKLIAHSNLYRQKGGSGMRWKLAALIWCSILHLTAQTALSRYIDTAIRNNPSLKAYQSRSGSLQQKIKSSKALEDPMLYGGIMNLPVNFSVRQDMMTMKQIGIQQNFSVSKKYSIRGVIAQKEYEASTYDVQAQHLSLIKEIKQQYYNLYAQKKAIETTRSAIETMKSYLEVANSRYSIGQGTQQDVFKAQVEITKMQNELIRMQSMQEDQIAIFNTLLARSKADSITITELSFKKANLEMDSLLPSALKNNPLMLASKKMLAKDSASYQLAKTDKIPEFNSGLWYGQRQALMPNGMKAMDMIGFNIGLTLPVWSKQKQNPMIQASQIDIQKSQYQIEALRNEIELMIHHSMVDAAKSEKLIVLFEKQLIPQAKENINAGLVGYQQNKIDFMTLTDNFLSLYTYRLEYFQSIADYYKAVAELEMLTGKKLIAD